MLLFDGISKTIEQAINTSELTSEIRVGDYLYEKYDDSNRKFLSSINSEDQKEIKRILDAIFLARIKQENLRRGCNSLFDFPLCNFSTYSNRSYEQESFVELKNGHESLINELIRPQREAFMSKVRLKHYLKKISIYPFTDTNDSEFYKRNSLHSQYCSNKDKIVLLISDASGQNAYDYVCICEKLLCTMSLGFLKENFNNLLEPVRAWPNTKREAISRLGFSTINKVVTQKKLSC
jgi:hypothetical protein